MAHWVLDIPLPVWSLNEERSMHWAKHGQRTKEMRGLTAILARNAKIPRLDIVQIEAWPLGKSRLDVGNAYPAVKSAQDGLRDAGVLPDDTPKHVHRLTMHPAIPGKIQGLRLLIIDAHEFD